MALIHFYEKPGCANNARQKRMLKEAGHELIVHDLLATPWGIEELRLFFGERPVAEWFNRAAPRVKSGEIVPEALDGEEALAMMLEDRLLIRRPLMRVGERREAGFDPDRVQAWIGLSSGRETADADLESCRRPHPCPPP
ncbi:MAG: ArsC/Spx/MgsR family protein [Pseudomonadota bacterium]